ncbi:MAG: group 1 truncated hemoglobin [Betaproteobacteria bacterium]|nr:group 1 truncated hemoglobin [Betaproteobacteria bacterium]NBT75554.1 group 1 truncated hemoglobin [Betaproteobacteria bacterium]NCA15438.1 group 1 truncated hemoglobin [Betaproteobacteria bacterium]NDF03886.1 group 1 truncated hemoglobin [Betaproteobacteria bacterium]
MEQPQTLFDKYGGVPTITGVVRSFYRRVLEQPNLARYFIHTDMEALIDHQIKFFAYVMGKPAEIYTGRDMKTAHESAGITQQSFDQVAELLRETLEDAGVEPADVQAAMERVASFQSQIVSRR